MGLRNFKYDGKRIKVRVCSSAWQKFRGLMFRKKSPSLLFVFNKEKKISIHSFFCKPFKAIWLDSGKRIVKEVDVQDRGFFSGRGRFLLEIPFD